MTEMTPQRGHTVPPNWQERFLRALAKRGNIAASCRAARVSRNFVYEHAKADAGFKALWDDALETACDSLEDEAWRRAHDGVLEPVYQGGAKVGTIRKYSDGLMIKLLQAHRPGKYRETVRNEHTGLDGAAIVISAIEVVRPDGDGSG